MIIIKSQSVNCSYFSVSESQPPVNEECFLFPPAVSSLADQHGQCESQCESDGQCESENPQFLEAEVGCDVETGTDDEDVNVDETLTTNNASTDIDLYNGAPLTVAASSIMIMQYKMCHNLTDQALAATLSNR